ncbi:MAG: hypothetical protein QNK19_03240 [Xanthomonadales bacterium]|nr:hypothetical protein [Xanthomonadales bacterium]
MFFYISLLVGSIVAAVVLLYFVHAIMNLGRSAYTAMLPGAKKDRRTSHLENTRFSEHHKMQTPWGWKGHASPASVARTHPAMPLEKTTWDWKGKDTKTTNKSQTEKSTGLDGFLASEAAPKPTVGWPYREDKLDVAGSAYKVTRKAKPVKTNLRDNGKPWGW